MVLQRALLTLNEELLTSTVNALITLHPCKQCNNRTQWNNTSMQQSNYHQMHLSRSLELCIICHEMLSHVISLKGLQSYWNLGRGHVDSLSHSCFTPVFMIISNIIFLTYKEMLQQISIPLHWALVELDLAFVFASTRLSATKKHKTKQALFYFFGCF